MKLIPLGVWGGYPKANSGTSSFLLKLDDFSCLIDCGSGVLSSLQNYLPLEQLDAVMISHYHFDHIADIGCLQYAMLVQSQLGNRKKELPIFGHAKDEEAFSKLSFMNYTRGIPIEETKTLILGPWKVTFCPTIHPAHCLAMKFEHGDVSIVFTADTEWCEDLVSFAKGATILVSEANLYDRHIGKVKGHMSGRQAGELAQKAGVDQLILTHLPHHGNLEDILSEAKQAFLGNVEIAQVGKAYEVVVDEREVTNWELNLKESAY
ncbi:MBL fold metallo-hydrolase [Alkalihalobacillus sp. MEB203]|uniref:MBL fold metallo-hydrolase n=1 Tax=Alkalihalobacterium chitinilyticum TaxID=2980103 RepID=A0ABT5VLW0_9BACI|nr:MBL fold metallo-hydrolase [Alkalihalobacterium chitinilyticum]